MKIEDVIKAIETTIEVAEDSLTCHGYNEATEQLIDMHKITLEALKKQVAKKPRIGFIGDGVYRLQVRICDSCNNAYLQNGQEHCHECGTKIDWSVEE